MQHCYAKASKRIKKTDLFNALYTLNEICGYEARLAMHAGYDFEVASTMHCQGYYVLHTPGYGWTLKLGTDFQERCLSSYVCSHDGLRGMLDAVKTITQHVKALRLARLGADIDQLEDKMLVEDRF
jgi:hypothetical protein